MNLQTMRNLFAQADGSSQTVVTSPAKTLLLPPITAFRLEEKRCSAPNSAGKN